MSGSSVFIDAMAARAIIFANEPTSPWSSAGRPPCRARSTIDAANRSDTPGGKGGPSPGPTLSSVKPTEMN